jgi:hypothetical protein
MYFLKNRFIEIGLTGSLPVSVQVGPSTGSGTGSVFKTLALPPPWPNEESLAHNQPVVCLLHHEPNRSEVAQVLLLPE